MLNYFETLGLSVRKIEGQDEATIARTVDAAHEKLYARTVGSYANVPRKDGRTQAQWQVILNDARDTLKDPQKRREHIAELPETKKAAKQGAGKKAGKRVGAAVALLVVLVLAAWIFPDSAPERGAGMRFGEGGEDRESSPRVERYLTQVDTAIGAGDYGAALAALDEVLTVRTEEGLETPDGFWYRHAAVALAAGAHDRAKESAARYVESAGRGGENYNEALAVLGGAEAARVAEESDRRAAAEAARAAEESDRRAAAGAARAAEESDRRAAAGAARASEEGDPRVAAGAARAEDEADRRAVVEAVRASEEADLRAAAEAARAAAAGRRAAEDAAQAADDEARVQAARMEAEAARRAAEEAKREVREAELRGAEGAARDVAGTARRRGLLGAVRGVVEGARAWREEAAAARRRAEEAERAAEEAERRAAEEAERAETEAARRAANSTAPIGPAGMEFVWVPPGEFDMGSNSSDAVGFEQPVTRVRISQGFWLGKYEVTQAEWGAVMGESPSSGCGRCPVESVTWDGVEGFLREVNSRGGGERYRLPTEAEWEYAARAGTIEDRYGDLNAIAWWGRNSRGGTHAVGDRAPNRWGLHDMLGNVWEWTGDWYGSLPGGEVTDPRGPATGSDRVYRGCSWLNGPRHCRTPFRNVYDADNRNDYLGFRLVRVPP